MNRLAAFSYGVYGAAADAAQGTVDALFGGYLMAACGVLLLLCAAGGFVFMITRKK